METRVEKVQYWFCEKCKTTGRIKYWRDAGVQEVVNSIFDNHRRRQPDCKGGAWDIRVQNEPLN